MSQTDPFIKSDPVSLPHGGPWTYSFNISDTFLLTVGQQAVISEFERIGRHIAEYIIRHAEMRSGKYMFEVKREASNKGVAL